MGNTLGNKLTVTLFGESHGEEIGATLDGFPAGVEILEENIKFFLAKRRPSGKGETSRVEEDEFRIISGVYNSHSTGAPITILIKNKNKRSSDYQDLSLTPRPSHADFAANMKYSGYNDPRGGGSFSGRLTAPLVALSGIVIPFLKSKKINVATHIKELGGIDDTSMLDVDLDEKLMDSLLNSFFPTIEEGKADLMKSKIEEVASQGDSIGGLLETAVTGLPVGLGGPNFDSVESKLSHAIFSIPGIKGITFGAGMGFKDGTGSSLNDQFEISEGYIRTTTNNNGGVNGGISNGMPVIFQTLVKPTPSISKPQQSVNIQTLENQTIQIKGRHDPAFIRRAVPVVDAMTSFVILDLIISTFGERL